MFMSQIAAQNVCVRWGLESKHYFS
jgi:hypothetical protein